MSVASERDLGLAHQVIDCALGLSSIIPVAHVILTQGLSHARQALSLDLTLLSGASYIVGALL